MSKPRNYFICTVQRSGKSWLCTIITRLQSFGAPEEYLKGIYRLNYQSDTQNLLYNLLKEKSFTGIRDYVQLIHEEKTGLNRPLGLAIQSNQLQLLANKLGLSPLEAFTELRKAFDDPAIFLLTREDIAAQAVSHYFMVTTGVANSLQLNKEKTQISQNIEYDHDEILKWYHFTRKGYEFWRDIFLKSNIDPIHIIYEELRKNLNETIYKIVHHINDQEHVSLEQIFAASQSGSGKLSFTRKSEFVEKFKKSLA